MENEIIQNLKNESESELPTPNRDVLREPIKHSLIDIFKELKFGRTSASQKYLQKCIEELEECQSNL